MSLQNVLNEALNLAKFKNKEPEAIKFLLMELSGYTGSEFYMSLKKPIDPKLKERFFKAVEIYLEKDIPVQHILGYSYFYGYQFEVNNDVLIPRRETEELVEYILIYADKYLTEKETLKVLDLGSGSGCIAISLSLENQKMQVLATDISEAALKTAKRNNEKLNARVSFRQSDLFSEINETFDIIVSNPPYIPDEEILEEIVKKEPHLALFGGKKGLDFYERILKEASQYLHEDGLIAFEHGYQQKEDIKALAETYFKKATIIQKQDMQGKDRFTFVCLGGVVDEKR
ncbi:MAG: peptide chain release factor N(5)-glutamine methyltransferase [Candidatus Phytoplasma sp.]|nr:peptide chain release factor N(5)-glutamine methyltransferase [Phytoplasma sp.]